MNTHHKPSSSSSPRLESFEPAAGTQLSPSPQSCAFGFDADDYDEMPDFADDADDASVVDIRLRSNSPVACGGNVGDGEMSAGSGLAGLSDDEQPHLFGDDDDIEEPSPASSNPRQEYAHYDHQHEPSAKKTRISSPIASPKRLFLSGEHHNGETNNGLQAFGDGNNHGISEMDTRDEAFASSSPEHPEDTVGQSTSFAFNRPGQDSTANFSPSHAPNLNADEADGADGAGGAGGADAADAADAATATTSPNLNADATATATTSTDGADGIGWASFGGISEMDILGGAFVSSSTEHPEDTNGQSTS